jgi:DNA-binding XRE family transcriptional regulator
MIIDGEHNTMSPDCWCNPKIEIEDNGNKVIIHNDVTPEQARVISDIELAKETSLSTCEFMRKIRKIRKLSILEVAEKSGINRNTISEIENGNAINKASVTTLSSIAHAIGCDLRIELIPFEKITKL